MDELKTPKPGQRISPRQKEKELIEAFRSIYRHRSNDQPLDIPTWCTFSNAVAVSEDVINESALKQHETFLVFFEPHKQVWESSLNGIQRYFKERKPWEDYDIYIFPHDLKWCIAFTHEQMNGIMVLATGDFDVIE